MYTHKTHQWMAGLVSALLCIPLAATAQTESSVLHGRVSFDAGGTLLRGTDENDWSSGSVNTLILPGDTVWVDNGGTTELEFSGGTFLRMADGSKAEIQSVSPGAAVRAWVGSFYVHRLNRSSGSFIFYTPSGIIEVDKDSSVRIDILDGELTTVSTRWGRATVRTDAGGSVQATAGRRVYIETGLLPSEPAPFDRTSSDPFDQWNRERSEFYATGSTSTPSAVGISANTIGASDLDRYGEWVTIDSTPYWRPTAIVDYTPYHHGYWNNVGPIGSVWVGNYPFSYVTSHHGYWDYHNHHGWIWSYTPRWSPAWAATVRYGDYFVWAPVNRHFHPVYPRSSAHFNIGGVSFGFHGTSYVHVDHLYHGPRYVDYAYHDTFRHYHNRGNVTVNIWNINTHSPRPYVNVPYNRSVQTVRNYTPRRNIRGASTFLASGRSATDRVQRLESTSGRSNFSRASRTGGQFERTNASQSRVANRTRVARIDQSTPDFARASRSNPVRATNDGPRRTDIDPRSDTPSTSRGRSTASRTPGRGDESRTTTRTPSRSDRGSVTTRTPSRSDRGNATTRTPSRSDRGNATTRTPSRSDRGNATTRTPSRSDRGNATTRTPSRSDRGNATTRTPSRSDFSNTMTRTPNRSNSSTTTTRTPNRSDSSNVTTRTPSRSSSATSRTPSRSSTTSRSTSRSNSTSSRSYRAPSRTASSELSTPRQSVAPTRSSTSSRTLAPRSSTTSSRSNATSRQSTPTRISQPSSTRTPLYNNAPSNSGRTSTRNVAPSRSSSSSSRSVSTPAPRQSTPRVTAPSRSSSSRSVSSTPRTRSSSSSSARVPSNSRRR